MFESVEALKAAYPTATPNDYAYIIGGNVWIWHDDGGWQNSNKPTPNTAVPASDATPLMDGVASAGTLGAYSRGDHRHASDTSKVNKSGDTMTGLLKIDTHGQTTVYGSSNEAYSHLETTAPNFYMNKPLQLDGALINYTTGYTVVNNGAEVYDRGQRVFSPHNLPTALKDYADGQAAYLEYGSRALDLSAFTYLACWSGHVVRAVEKIKFMADGYLLDDIITNAHDIIIPTHNSKRVAFVYGKVNTPGSSATFQSITFPIVFLYVPLVLTTYHATDSGNIENMYGWVRSNSVTQTGFSARSYGGKAIEYLAIGTVNNL